MKQERMQLTLVPSTTMDKWARKNPNEHTKVRLSRRARVYYGPSDWEKIYLSVHGAAANKKLRIDQAPKSDMKLIGTAKAKRIGFVTTETYKTLMGQQDEQENKSIWISENVEKIAVGADPEFVIYNQSTGEAIYGDNIYNPHGEKWGQVGSDGPCVELRPSPATDVAQLVSNIETLLKTKTGRIQDLGWIGGATYTHRLMDRIYPIGGHLHFGLPKIDGAGVRTNNILQNRVVRILDELVAVPLIRIDTPQPAQRRQRLGYGRFEDVRRSDFKFEWRVPSGLWLVHPDLARAVIGTSKAVVEECWKRYADRDCDQDFMLSTADDNDTLLSSFNCIKSDKVRELINNASAASVDTDLVHTIHGKLRSMSTYCMYKDEIKLFISLCCDSNMPLPTSKLDLKLGWLEGKSL